MTTKTGNIAARPRKKKKRLKIVRKKTPGADMGGVSLKIPSMEQSVAAAILEVAFAGRKRPRGRFRIQRREGVLHVTRIEATDRKSGITGTGGQP